VRIRHCEREVVRWPLSHHVVRRRSSSVVHKRALPHTPEARRGRRGADPRPLPYGFAPFQVPYLPSPNPAAR